MARYIDADKLNKDVLASWDKDKHVTLEASRVHRQEHHHLMSIIEKQPTADVVPRSEVDKEIKEWQELYADTVDKWEKAYEELEIKFEALKGEVAREIFEEIDRMCIDTFGNFNHRVFAELKKKHIRF